MGGQEGACRRLWAESGFQHKALAPLTVCLKRKSSDPHTAPLYHQHRPSPPSGREEAPEPRPACVAPGTGPLLGFWGWHWGLYPTPPQPPWHRGPEPPRGPEECSGDGQLTPHPAGRGPQSGARVHIGGFHGTPEKRGDTAQHPRGPPATSTGGLPAYTSKAPREAGGRHRIPVDGGRHRIPVGWGSLKAPSLESFPLVCSGHPGHPASP